MIRLLCNIFILFRPAQRTKKTRVLSCVRASFCYHPIQNMTSYFGSGDCHSCYYFSSFCSIWLISLWHQTPSHCHRSHNLFILCWASNNNVEDVGSSVHGDIPRIIFYSSFLRFYNSTIKCLYLYPKEISFCKKINSQT